MLPGLNEHWKAGMPSNVVDGAELFPLALNSHRINFDVQNNKPPKLVQLKIHPKFFRSREFLVHEMLLFGDQGPAGAGFEFPDECVVKHELHPSAA